MMDSAKTIPMTSVRGDLRRKPFTLSAVANRAKDKRYGSAVRVPPNRLAWLKYAVCVADINDATTTGSRRQLDATANVRPWWPIATGQWSRTKCQRCLKVTRARDGRC